MATALIAWLSAPAPTTCTSTAPAWRTAPAMAPATEFGFERVETFKVSIKAPQGRHASPRLTADSTRDARGPSADSFRLFRLSLRGGAARGRRPVPRSVVVEGDRLVVPVEGDDIGAFAGVIASGSVDPDLGVHPLGDVHHDL